LLAVERKQNKTTKEELANAQKTIDELVHESQQSQEIRNQLEDTIKRFKAESTARDTILLSEKQAHETTKKVLTEIQSRNEELIKKIQDCDKNILELQLTVERLQENTSTTEALLLREREQNNATMKAQAETQEINLQLLNKLEDVETKIGLLQGSVQRLGDNTAKDTLLLSEKREKDALKEALTESEYKNEELMIKTEEANKKGLRRTWQLLWKLKDKKMKQSRGPLLKLRRETMHYLRKLGIANTGPTSFKILSKSFK